ncbi:MAG: YceI family protein [Acidimicrobiia bacterium]|nr:YceI family protein [Acidimicrobiia bacterium]
MSTAIAPSGLAALTAGTWTVDPSHSTVGFTARHLMITKVHGHFTDFDGTVTVADDPLASSVVANVRLASVDTGSADRDAHLHTADFFDVETYPEMTLRSTAIAASGDDFVLTGDLTIAGQTRSVDFALEFDGVRTDPFGNTKAGFSARTEINRSDWGLSFNMALDTGGVLVSEKIQVELDVQLVKS